LIGYNRSEYGHAAGLCTTILVCLAASVAMLQVNYLVALSGRSLLAMVAALATLFLWMFLNETKPEKYED
jgi:uncharacterized membrane protein YhiD involved in acid resistance